MIHWFVEEIGLVGTLEPHGISTIKVLVSDARFSRRFRV